MAFDLASLNPEQRDAVITFQGPVLILAGAGTGKTRTLTCRIAHMIDRGVAPGHILAVTFTNKAAREMQERVNDMVPRSRGPKRNRDEPEDPYTARPTLCTFHSLCVRVLRQHIEKLGYKRNFVIYDEGDQLAAMKKILSAISAKGEKTDAGAVLSMLSKFKNAGPNSPVFGDESVRALAQHVSRKYESALRAANAVDFDDLILLTLRLFREHEDALEACRRRWRYVMVDEYQDTNSSQFELVHFLTKESRNLCVVGDDDQSIYGWRGAEIANILGLEKHYPEVKVIKLEQNYRSTNTILKAANAVIRNNTLRRGKNLWSSKGAGSKIVVHSFATDDEEATTVADNIEYDRVAKRVTWGGQAILFRTNLQARPIETALRKARIRYRLIGGQSFFDRREIRDFLAYVKTFVNPEDDVALLRIANTPARGLSDVTMERLLAFSSERNTSVHAVMKHTDVQASFQARTGEAIRQLVAFIDRMRQPLLGMERVSLSAWADGWLKETGYLEDLRRQDKDPEVADNRARNISELVASLDGGEVRTPRPAAKPGPMAGRSLAVAAGLAEPEEAAKPAVEVKIVYPPPTYTGSPMDRLNEFLEDLTLDSDRESDKDDAGDLVTLITMHAAKGLEFPHVQIVGVEDGLLPHARSKVEGTLDEERRLFYVAITRAQESLRISHCASRRKYGQFLPCHPSAFLKEIPADCYDSAEGGAGEPVDEKGGDDFFAAMRAALGDE
jgi:DNA helicase II / ATP-dependent DNA helicase PcrA